MASMTPKGKEQPVVSAAAHRKEGFKVDADPVHV